MGREAVPGVPPPEELASEEVPVKALRSAPLVVLCACAPAADWSAPPGVAMTRVEILQGPQVLLMDEGDEPDQELPLVAGRDGIVRVHYRTSEDYDGLPVTARLTLGDRELEQEVTLYAESRPGIIAGTVNFELGTELTLGETELVAELMRPGEGEDPALRYPAEGTRTLFVDVPRTTLRVHVVPFAYRGDGSGRPPVLHERRLAEMRGALLAHFPVEAVELTVGDEEQLDHDFTRNLPEDWAVLREATRLVREADQPDPEVYYYGALRPFDALAHCGEAGFSTAFCTHGMAYLPAPDEDHLRVAVGAAYPERLPSLEVLVHELGHAFGRRHSGCETADTDPDHPNPGPGLESDAWDIAARQLVDADRHTDMMGYCHPYFVSAYTYSGLAARILDIAELEGR